MFSCSRNAHVTFEEKAQLDNFLKNIISLCISPFSKTISLILNVLHPLILIYFYFKSTGKISEFFFSSDFLPTNFPKKVVQNNFVQVCCVPSGDFFSTKYQNSMVEKGEWGYFDYKYMRDLFSPSTLALFSWNSLGLKAGLIIIFFKSSRFTTRKCSKICSIFNFYRFLSTLN